MPPDAKLNAVAMILSRNEDNSFNYVGRTFELADNRLYEQNPLKLSLVASPSEIIDPIFLSDIQPILKSSCTPCHAGYEGFSLVKSKAKDFKSKIADGSMPKETTLTQDQIKTLTEYLIKLYAGQ